MIFTYVHKMFRTKERKCVGSINTADTAATEVGADLLEGALRAAFPLNRSVLFLGVSVRLPHSKICLQYGKAE